MDLYQYIAETRPDDAEAICQKYGWSLQNIQTSDDLASCLQNLVAEEGEPAMMDLVSIHPDKDLIVECYLQSQGASGAGTSAAPAAGGCGCGKCKGAGSSTGEIAKLLHAAKGGKDAGPLLHQGNLMIIGGVVLIALAIVINNKPNSN